MTYKPLVALGLLAALFVALFSVSATAMNMDSTTPPPPGAIHVVSKDIGLDLTTAKVARITGPVNEASDFQFSVDMLYASSLAGPLVILIDSSGGSVRSGQHMLGLMMKEHSAGVPIICVGKGWVASMAFNIMSFCDVRLSAPATTYLAHKIAIFPTGVRLTAKIMRQIASDLDKEDEMFRQVNAATMHMSLDDYDKIADDEKEWTDLELFNIHWLQGYALVTK